MNFTLLPTLLYALTLGYQTPSGLAITDGHRTILAVHEEATVVAIAFEAQWADTFFLGGDVKTTAGTDWGQAGGFQPYQAEYRVWAGFSLYLEAFRLTARASHDCYHPISSFSKPTVGFFGGNNQLSITVESGRFLGR